MKNKTRLLICGGRDFDNYNMLDFSIDKILAQNKLSYDQIEVVSGHADGADTLGELYAKKHNINLKTFPADWSNYGRAAGPIRNKQMIDYIKNGPAVVAAFVSPKSIGTKNTIALAKQENIKTYEIAYSNKTESFASLTEGITVNNGSVIYDFNVDTDDDIINICETKINVSKLNSKMYYFGYRVNKNTNKNDRQIVLKTIKSEDEEIERLIDRSIELFYSSSEIKKFDYLITIPSSSTVNDKIANRIANIYEPNCKVLTAQKLPTTNLELNTELINKKFNYNDLSKVYDYFNQMILNIKKDDEFSISKIPPKYRRYFKSMIQLDNNIKINNSVNTNLLIIDDILTTGTSITMLIDELEKINYLGTITIFTLINNR